MARQTELEFTKTPRRKSKNLNELNENLKRSYDNLTSVLRPELNKLVKHEVQLAEVLDLGGQLTADIPKMVATLANFYVLAGNEGFNREASVEGGGGTTRFGRVESAFEEVKRKTKSLFDARIFNGKEFGHQDVTPAGLRLFGFIEATINLEKAIKDVGVIRRSGKEYVRESAVEKLPVKVIGLKQKTIGELRKARKAAQKMFAGISVLEKLPTQKDLNSKTKWSNLAAEVNKVSNLEELVTLKKEKYYDVLNGNSSVKLKVELKNDNRFKAFYERAFGINLSRIQKGTTKLDSNLKNEFLDKIDVTKITGSDSLEDKVVKDLANIAAGKKVTKKSIKSAASSSIKPPTYKFHKFTSVGPLIELQKKAKEASNFVNGTTLETKKFRESGGGLTQREINKLRLQINRRLPAEVRRNMGRPALINQTGRFSNSVELTELRRGPKTLVGEYRYMFNPYETFENEGERQWPTGYNPKPLITKSIRKLALQYTDERFTLRRE